MIVPVQEGPSRIGRERFADERAVSSAPYRLRLVESRVKQSPDPVPVLFGGIVQRAPAPLLNRSGEARWKQPARGRGYRSQRSFFAASRARLASSSASAALARASFHFQVIPAHSCRQAATSSTAAITRPRPDFSWPTAGFARLIRSVRRGWYALPTIVSDRRPVPPRIRIGARVNFFQALQADDFFEIAWDIRPQAAGAGHLVPMQRQHHGVRERCPLKGNAASPGARTGSRPKRIDISIAGEALASSNCSGAMYSGVPITLPACVSCRLAAGCFDSICFAMPKSAIFGTPSAAKRTFAGLRSR